MAPDEHEQPDADQPSDDVDSLLDIIERAISTGRPIDVIGLASAAIAIVLFPEQQEDPERFVLREKVLEQVVLRYVEVGSPEALIYANALTLLLPNETLRASLAPALDGSESALPEWLARVEESVLEQPTIVRDLFDDDEWRHGIHGGAVETSIMLAFRPDLVRMDKLRDNETLTRELEKKNRLLRMSRPAALAWAAQDLNASGAMGDAKKASAEKGNALIDFGARQFLKLIEEMGDFGRLREPKDIA